MKSLRIILTILGLASGSFAAEIKVPADCPTITKALASANNGDTIRVAPGTYCDANESFPLRLDKAVTLEGDDPNNKPHLKGDKKNTVVLIESGGANLRGFHITDGMGSEGINNMDGGGVCIFVSPDETNAVTIDNCVIEKNACPSDETYDGCGGGIYCGGTYCECFEIHIRDCTILNNDVNGCGGGVFCALLSNVKIQNTRVEENCADDHGGGIFVDMFAIADLNDTHLLGNHCLGDPQKSNWGGKGGGLACESFAIFTATDCNFAKNTASYFGGAIFTCGGIFEGEDICGGTERFPYVLNSRIEENRADVSGGGAYVARSAVLTFSGTTFYWNDARQDGGAVFVAGGATGGGVVDFNDGCVLEGNESARNGGGVYLGTNTLGTFQSTRFLGNSTLWDGGAIYLDTEASGDFNNCSITYNNSARGYAGGIRTMPESSIDVNHCSIVGNFAPHKRSGIYLDAAATADIKDSILWRNAGGSVEANGSNVSISCSLNEDGPDPAKGVICGDPNYVGWGSRKEIYVDSSKGGPGTGTPADPYLNLQLALDGFDFTLAADSPCIGEACDGGNLGADAGVGGTAGNITALLYLTDGAYDIRGRNIIFIRDIQGTDPNTTIIRHAVFGYVEDAYLRNVGITVEEIFGGITTRADVSFEKCNIAGNTALADGGGIYVADGNCILTDTLVSANTSSGNGGGIYLCPQTSMELTSSRIEENTAVKGGGCFASSMTANNIAESTIAQNISSGSGGGLYLDVNSVSSLMYGQVSGNKANTGAGMYLSGHAIIEKCEFSGNDAGYVAGALLVDSTADVNILDSSILSNHAGDTTGGILCFGKAHIFHCLFQANKAAYGAAIQVQVPASLVCESSQFIANDAWQGGALRCWVDTAPLFVDCNFVENKGYWGGAGICEWGSHPTFDSCCFRKNTTYGAQGGSFFLRRTSARFTECTFSESSSTLDGGVAFCCDSDVSIFEKCNIEESVSGASGGAFYITDSAQPVFSNVQIVDSQAGNNGGAIAILGTSKPKFSDVSISDCQAIYGGGIYAGEQSRSLFQQCEFQNNRAYELTTSADGGGAFFTEDANGWFSRCAFTGNSAQDDGGGMAVAENAKVDLRNTLFAANTAQNTGGGAYFTSNSVGTFTNCTIISKKDAAGQSGGGIYLDPNNIVKVDSSIICQNNPYGIRPESNPDVKYSCVQETWPGTSNRLCDDCCMLDPLTFALLDGSPCIDAGNPDPNMDDACQPPGKGVPRNDMGITGGPDNCVTNPQYRFNFASFSDPAFLVLRGSAAFKDGFLRLTEAQYGLVGCAWYAFPVSVQGGFETTFDFRIDRDGADGIAFVIQNYSLAALGYGGGSLGYNIPNSLAVEFDTHPWDAGGPSADHISVQTRGTQINSLDHKYSLGSTTSIPFLCDNKPHKAKIAYVRSQLRIYVDDIARLTVSVNLRNLLSLTEGSAFIGLTGATGDVVETHDILNWSFSSAAGPAGDIDGDGKVDFVDFEHFASQWLETSTIIIPKDADLDYNCRVDFHDFSIFAQNWL